MLGYSDDPDESEYVDLDEKLAVKVFSICQDIVYNNSRRKTQTPKSLALAISIRQISVRQKFPNSVLVRNITACETAQKLELAYVMIKRLRQMNVFFEDGQVLIPLCAKMLSPLFPGLGIFQ